MKLCWRCAGTLLVLLFFCAFIGLMASQIYGLQVKMGQMVPQSPESTVFFGVVSFVSCIIGAVTAATAKRSDEKVEADA